LGRQYNCRPNETVVFNYIPKETVVFNCLANEAEA
jgi:hypothetical protein